MSGAQLLPNVTPLGDADSPTAATTRIGAYLMGYDATTAVERRLQASTTGSLYIADPLNATGHPTYAALTDGTHGPAAVTTGNALSIADTLNALGHPDYAAQVVSTNNANAVPHMCGSIINKHITTATDTQILAASGSTTIYVCDYDISFGGTGNAYLEKSTSGTCASPTQIAQTWYGVAGGGKSGSTSYYRGLNTGASAQLCINTSAAISADVTVYYDQY